MTEPTTPTPPANIAEDPNHPHHSILASTKKVMAHMAAEAKHLLPYFAEFAQIALMAGVHMSPQATIAAKVITTVVAAEEAKKAPAEPSPSTPTP